MTGLLACTSHLLVDLPLFAAPVLFVLGAVFFISRSERRREDDGGESALGRPGASHELAHPS